MATFRLGINMAGAISAGAYTAGVLDFLTEALDEWQKAKDAGEAVPKHDVRIEVFSGASAGGMCAAISSVMLQQEFEHIHDTSKTGTNNTFYESWVNKIDIAPLLGNEDLKQHKQLVSMLDSSIIRKIAAYALDLKQPIVSKPYVSPDLTLFLSLTNLRGVPYSLNAAAPGSVDETTFFYGDRIRFQTTRTGQGTTLNVSTRTIDLLSPGAKGGWDVLQKAAMSTGAFPVFLAPGILERRQSEYTPPVWESIDAAASGTPPPVAPNFPPEMPDPFETLNVDGGVTNNDPFNYSHAYLASLAPTPTDDQRAGKPEAVDRAVLTVAPFPTIDQFEVKFDAKSASVFTALPKLFSALISQARFFGEDLSEVMHGATFNRFVIVPSDSELAHAHEAAGKPLTTKPSALQCASLGAFGGFFERGFRAHDFELGRRNCQKFLLDHFLLPVSNPTMQSWWSSLSSAEQEAMKAKYGRQAPGTYAHSAADLKARGCALPKVQEETSELWFPLIPLCGGVTAEAPHPERVTMDGKKLDGIVDGILKRYQAVAPYFIELVPSVLFRVFLRMGQPVIRMLARGPLKKKLVDELGDSYQP